MKYWNIKMLSLLCAVFVFTACSEDDLIIDDSLAKPQYVLPQGEPGSLQALIYEVYERYGTYVLYDFDELDIRPAWTTTWRNWYVPVKEGNEKYAQQMIHFIQDNLLEGYTDDFVRANLVYRIFLVDSLCTSSSYDEDNVADLVTKEHAWIISNVGPQLEEWTETEWTALKNELTSKFTLSFYDAAPIKPTQFMALREPGIVVDTKEADPEGKYEKEQYGFYKVGYVRWMSLAHGRPNSMTPKEPQDFADYITFLTTTPATELAYVLKRFDRMRERAQALVPYLNNMLHLDVIVTQNKNCPEDKIPADFFSTL